MSRTISQNEDGRSSQSQPTVDSQLVAGVCYNQSRGRAREGRGYGEFIC